MATAKRVARAAVASCSIGITVRNVGRSTRPVLMIARRATHAIGAATAIGIRSDPRVATSATAKTTVATVNRIVSVSIAAAGIAVALARRRAARAVRSAVVARAAIRTTTSIPDRRLLRRRTRITRYVVRGISC